MQEHGEQPAPPGFVEGLEEYSEAALRDGVGAAQGAAGLQHRRDGQVRSGEGHGLLIAGEVLAVAAEPGDEVTPAEPEGERPGPVAAPKLRDVTRPPPVPAGQEAGRLPEQNRLAVHGYQHTSGRSRTAIDFPCPARLPDR